MVEVKSGREECIKENLGLVHSICRRFAGRGIEYDDLYQAGCMGLVKAYDAFDSSRGVKFSTYAVPVILGEIKRLFRDGGAVKVSRGIKELSLKGNHNLSNVLACVAVCKILKIPNETIINGIKSFKGAKHRLVSRTFDS